MLRLTAIVLDVLVLAAFTTDCIKTNKYLEEMKRMKHEIWKLDYKVNEMGSMLSRYKHG